MSDNFEEIGKRVDAPLFDLYPRPDGLVPVWGGNESDPDRFLHKAKASVVSVLKSRYGLQTLTTDQFYIVWFSKTLQNWKALVSSDEIQDSQGPMYFEVTYNGDKRETYVDLYVKRENHVIPD